MWPFWYGWWFPFHGLFSLLLLVILILVLNSALRGHRYARYGRTAALDTLEQRYARGEIQREEYLQKKPISAAERAERAFDDAGALTATAALIRNMNVAPAEVARRPAAIFRGQMQRVNG